MGNKLIYTSSGFMECTVATASRTGGTIYDILGATSSNRRVYGISVVNADNAANPVKVYLNDGVNRYQVSNVNLAANSGNSTSVGLTNVFISTMGESVFCKTRDANGIPYFNLPANWKIQLSLTNTPGAGEYVHTFVYGENY